MGIDTPNGGYMDVMLAHIPVGVALFDASDLRLLTANALFHTFLDIFLSAEWRNGRALGHSFIEWLPGAEETGMVAIFRAVAETGVPYRAGEYEFPAFEAGVTYWNWTLDPIRDEEGRIVQLVQVIVEVTAQVLARKQAENEFLSIASHELRTPITAIQGFAEILQMQVEQGKGFGPHSLRALAVISEQSQSLTCLIEEMLDLTRIENAKLNLHKAPHELREILAQVVETQAASTRQHILHLTLSGAAETDGVIGWFDKNRMVQVFSNLIGNAIKYSPDGGEIEVGLCYTSPARDEALIWVKDCGIGIAASDLPHIFKRFHRSSRVDRSINGLGIGLYLVQEFVTCHGGRIWAESIEGQGSTFYVQLPLSASNSR